MTETLRPAREAGPPTAGADLGVEYGGAHCETASMAKLLRRHGLGISEAMLLGLGGGISVMYWPGAFVGGRNGPFPVFTRRMAAGVGLDLELATTDEPDVAHRELVAALTADGAAICYGDLYYLPYFQARRHFGGHAFVVTGVDPDSGTVTISDRSTRPRTVDAAALAAARGSRHEPFAPRHARLVADWSAARQPDADTVRAAARASAGSMLYPRAPGTGLPALRELGTDLAELVRHAPADVVVDRLTSAYVDLELAGTGGRGFRVLYRDFLAEAAALAGGSALADAVPRAGEAIAAWGRFVDLLVPDWTTATSVLRAALLDREAALLAGGEQDMRRAADLSGRLPDYRRACEPALDRIRDRLADALLEAAGAVAAAEHRLAATTISA